MSEVYARLSDIAYSDPNKRGSAAEQYGYFYDNELSDVHSAVFYDADSNAVIAYRGTKLTDWSDINADLAIAAGSHENHSRFVKARELARRVDAKYGRVEVTGHSLGGTLANDVSKNYGYRGVVFNPGSSPIYKSNRADNIEVYRNSKDLASSGFKGKTVKRKRNFKDVLLGQTPSWVKAIGGQYLDHGVDQFFRQQ